MKIVTADRPAGRPRVRVSGAVDRVRASGPGGPPILRAELGGADRVTLVWLGRDSIPGIEPGRVLAAEGMLSQHGGRRIIYNPRYHLGTGPNQP